MILKNPLTQEVSISYLGTEYTIKPEGTINVPEQVAVFWKKIHGFLQVSVEETDEVKTEPVVTNEVKEATETTETTETTEVTEETEGTEVTEDEKKEVKTVETKSTGSKITNKKNK